jgi:hypothetical protein
MAIHAKPPGPIRMTDAAAPMGFNYNSMADTKIATSMAAFFVPHECLSGAKISILSETHKLFSNYFLSAYKNKGTQAQNPAFRSY